MLRVFLAVLLAGIFGLTQAQESTSATLLPPEARETLALIAQGGPFPYQRDGITFNNFEKRLPLMQRGYYHEYTVATPGVRHRGARRIVCGGAKRQPDACYYSADHYRSFRKIRE
jgi:ribonuclease T1